MMTFVGSQDSLSLVTFREIPYVSYQRFESVFGFD